MNILIACCGINCETCEARIATIKNDDKMRVEVAKKWCEMNHTDQITPESINCMGCRTEGIKFYFCSHLCEVHKCVTVKGYETCGECPDKNTCQKVGAIWENCAEAKDNLWEESKSNEICLLPKDKWEDALKLVKEVFMEFEAPDYCDEGIADFMHAINDKSYLNMHRFYGAYQDDKLVGVIATRNNHHHIGLLFVDKNYQHMGIGSQLIQNIMVLKDDGPITVNASPYGHEFYKKLGFVDTSEEQITNGVRYYPMERK